MMDQAKMVMKMKKLQKELSKEIISISEKALPYWEKCNSIKPDEQTTLETLSYLYVQLKRYDDAEKIKNQMDELGFNEN